MQEIEGKNRKGNTRDFFKKIRDIKGTFHAKMGIIKDKNCIIVFIKALFIKAKQLKQPKCPSKNEK